MGEVRFPPSAIEPSQWFVAFHETTQSKIINALPIGRFKHVTAFGYCAGFKAWLHIDPQFGRLRLALLSQSAMEAAARHGVLVKVGHGSGVKFFGRTGLYCVPVIRYVIGLPCVALTPDGLYRQILRNGGILIGLSQPDFHPAATAAVAARSVPQD